MHNKQKGNIGEAATILRLAQLGYNVFKEIGDLSKIDVIAEKDGSLLRIQCKCVKPKKGMVQLSLKKSGPGYQYTYKSTDVDYFALCNVETSEVAFIPSSIVNENDSNVNLRLEPSKNNQVKNVRFFADYLNIGT